LDSIFSKHTIPKQFGILNGGGLNPLNLPSGYASGRYEDIWITNQLGDSQLGEKDIGRVRGFGLRLKLWLNFCPPVDCPDYRRPS